MLVLGTYDDNVHPQNEWAFIDALIAAGKPFDMMVYPMRKHGFDDQRGHPPPRREDAGVLEAVPVAGIPGGQV